MSRLFLDIFMLVAKIRSIFIIIVNKSVRWNEIIKYEPVRRGIAQPGIADFLIRAGQLKNRAYIYEATLVYICFGFF
jgi:hypothetical protein